MLTDRGSCFTADGFERACRKLKVQHRMTKPYTPQTNGMVERFNGRVQREVLGITISSHRDLETLLRGFNQAYNRRRQRVLKGASPEQVVRSRLAAAPALANRRYKPPHPDALHQALTVVAAAKDVSHPDTEQVLEIVVGARQIDDGIAVEEARMVALGHLAEVVDGCRKRAGPSPMPVHGAQQSIKAPAHAPDRLASGVGEHTRDRVHPAIGAGNVAPERRSPFEPTADQAAEPGERRRECGAPFCFTRSRLLAIRSRRSCNFKPDAASGARPSSVSAERTAAQ